MSLILDGSVGVSDVDGSAATPAIRGTDANTGMFFPAADTIAFSEGGVESMRLNSSGVLVTTNDASISGLTVGKGVGTNNAFNTVFGLGAVVSNTTGGGLTAIGRSTLVSNTTGTDNTAVGGTFNANPPLYLNTTGSFNTALGAGTLASNTTASYNTAVGYQAGYANTGAQNTVVGGLALKNNTTGEYNAGFGMQSLQSNTTASNNAGFGYATLISNTTGAFNTALGSQSLYLNTTASNNTAVGFQAGYSNSTGAACTFVGNVSGYSNTTGFNNTFVGYGAGYNVSTGTKNTIIGLYDGNKGGLDIRTASNYIVLSDGDGNPAMHNIANQWTTTAFGNLDITQGSTTANVLAISQNTATNLFGGTNSFSGMFLVNDINNLGTIALILTGGNSLTIVSQTPGTSFVNSSTPNSVQIGIYITGSNIVTLKPGAVGTTNFRIMALRTRSTQ